MKAIYNAATNIVLTFIRDDPPPGFRPPTGYALVNPAALAEGWQFPPLTTDYLEQIALTDRLAEMQSIRDNLRDAGFTLTAAQINRAVKWLLLQALRQ